MTQSEHGKLRSTTAEDRNRFHENTRGPTIQAVVGTSFDIANTLILRVAVVRRAPFTSPAPTSAMPGTPTSNDDPKHRCSQSWRKWKRELYVERRILALVSD